MFTFAFEFVTGINTELVKYERKNQKLMSNFANERASREKQQERAWERLKEDARFYRDIAKLILGTSVLGEIAYVHNDNPNPWMIIFGLIASVFFAAMASKKLSKNK